ncbi:3-deoxy-manno-octulosonate cytidylyltransferase [Priestia megaterium]|uniref:3-deoxy-manno-octulosonate cytidylyltransferase n=1 Tax=Priestia megaterium TaxID=1404 RepID=UPI00203B283A|nr:3-deoxy-manno-octulosonate cytidylyltransferase [Priestia megaterium]MCM3150858.1 3-deoxy-manno-octulosonate cytidylyltransferase [Priestia megaterium]
MNYSVIIPARYESSRLPGKPLVDLLGIPMIIRTYQQCAKACDTNNIYVATDDERIKIICQEHNINVLMTSKNCLTGTDRVAECMNYLDSEVFINVQGDEPLFNPEDLKIMIRKAQEFPNEILNGYCEIISEKDFRSRSIPKVVFRPDNKLLYMSRGTIPNNKNNEFLKAWRQVCVYAFPRNALKSFNEKKEKTPLESLEDIEILRFLELGHEVRMIKLSNQSIAVDNPSDVQKVITELRKINN